MEGWSSIPQGPGFTHTSLIVLMDAFGPGEHMLRSATNMYPKDPANAPPVVLPPELLKLVDRLSSEGTLLEPWTDENASHSEIMLLASIVGDIKSDSSKEAQGTAERQEEKVIELGQLGMEFPSNSGVSIATTYAWMEDGESKSQPVRSCMNCTAIMNALSIVDVNADSSEERDGNADGTKGKVTRDVDE